MNRRTFIKSLFALPVVALAGKVLAERPKQGFKIAGVTTGRISSSGRGYVIDSISSEEAERQVEKMLRHARNYGMGKKKLLEMHSYEMECAMFGRLPYA